FIAAVSARRTVARIRELALRDGAVLLQVVAELRRGPDDGPLQRLRREALARDAVHVVERQRVETGEVAVDDVARQTVELEREDHRRGLIGGLDRGSRVLALDVAPRAVQ